MIKILGEMKGEYKVYVHINKINGKMYIGQTKHTLERRFNHGNGYNHCRHFNSSIKKYGWDNFEHIILFEDLSLDMANIIEEELIRKYNTTNHNNGYNMKSGGLNHIPSEETRKLLSEARKGEKHWNYGRHWGDDFKQKLSKIHKGREVPIEWREKMSKSRKGKKFSKEHKKSISESKMEVKNPMYGRHMSERAKRLRRERSKHILQYNLDGLFVKEWCSAKAVSEECNIDSSNIVRCCIGDRQSCNGFMWEYKIGDKIPNKTISYKERIKENTMISRYKKVYQYNLDGKFLKEFVSANAINRELTVNVNHIRDCCLGKLKTYLGYRWSYDKVDRLSPIKYKTNAIPVIQFKKDWTYVREWNSAREISKELNIDSASIGRCCKGKQETAGGYRWRYKTDCSSCQQ